MIYHSKKQSDNFGQKTVLTINKEIEKKNTVRNTVRTCPNLSETENRVRTTSDTCPKRKTSVTLINKGLSDLSELSEQFLGGVKISAKILKIISRSTFLCCERLWRPFDFLLTKDSTGTPRAGGFLLRTTTYFLLNNE